MGVQGPHLSSTRCQDLGLLVSPSTIKYTLGGMETRHYFHRADLFPLLTKVMRDLSEIANDEAGCDPYSITTPE